MRWSVRLCHSFFFFFLNQSFFPFSCGHCSCSVSASRFLCMSQSREGRLNRWLFDTSEAMILFGFSPVLWCLSFFFSGSRRSLVWTASLAVTVFRAELCLFLGPLLLLDVFKGVSASRRFWLYIKHGVFSSLVWIGECKASVVTIFCRFLEEWICQQNPVIILMTWRKLVWTELKNTTKSGECWISGVVFGV